MSNNARCIQVKKSEEYPDGLKIIIECFYCPCQHLNSRKAYVCDLTGELSAENGFLPDCPLLEYDKIKWHDSDELPNNEDCIEIMLENGSIYKGLYTNRHEWRGWYINISYDRDNRLREIHKDFINSWRKYEN